jgi:hypothetical protein
MKKKIIGVLISMLLSTSILTVVGTNQVSLEKDKIDNSTFYNFDGGGQIIYLAVTNADDGDISILLGDGEGGFYGRQDYIVGNSPRGIVAGDFDVDDVLDLAVTNADDGDISILLGDGEGGFYGRQDYPSGYYPWDAVAGDFDMDDVLDLAVTNLYDGDFSVFLGDGEGGFYDLRDYSLGHRSWGIITEDFDMDDVLDLAVINTYYSSKEFGDFSVFLGDGEGGFHGRQDYRVGTGPRGIVAGDFDIDGVLDLAVTNADDGDISILLGDGEGGFHGRQDYTVGSCPWGIVAGKFIIETQNNPPIEPIISGPETGKTGKKYEYTFISLDSDGDNLYYYIEWGDENVEEWIGPYLSGEKLSLNHSWNEKGNYTIRAKTRDVFDAESSWATLNVSIQKNKQSANSFLIQIMKRLMEKFPLLDQLIVFQ